MASSRSIVRFFPATITATFTDIITDIRHVEGGKSFSFDIGHYSASHLLKSRDFEILFMEGIAYFLIATSPVTGNKYLGMETY